MGTADAMKPMNMGAGSDSPQSGQPADLPAPPVSEPPVHDARSREYQQPSKLADKMQNWYDRVEAFISRLSSRDNFWSAICSFIWLPLAFFSGIKMKEINPETYKAYLPFRRFNRNWYSAMAGGALLANSEIAGGMYVFGICGGDYQVVCKNLNYTFLRPCLGPAVYHIRPRENLKELVATGKEFNVLVEMDILQQAAGRGQKDKRVGRCEATFHVTPKTQAKARVERRKRTS